ncbi:MAG TPA: hypothetical protein VMB27_03585 [Solirubrobacteraceae bacterium]|nr:hypothetical protein [Solirubrobacteraceae bacterium]
MRLEIELVDGGGAGPAPDLPPVRIPPRGRRRLDGFDASVLCLFAAVSLFVLGADLWQVIVHGRVWTGTDGVYIVDQMQYLAWIKDASHHVLASNLFVLRDTPADYFNPAVVVSGGLTALGMAPWLSLLLWKPVAVIAFFFAVHAFAWRLLNGLWPRRAALVLALFFGSFTNVYGHFSVLGDLFPGFLTWGYVFGVMALAAMVWALVAHNDSRHSNRRLWLAGLLGGLASLLHPWNGELLIAIVVTAEAVMFACRRYGRADLKLTAATVIGTGVPLLYYAILGKADISWKLAQVASKHAFSFWSITIAIVPLLVPAIVAYTRRPTTFLAAAARTWPVAAYAVFVLSGTSLGATPLHSFQGITIPLAVLAVEGLQIIGWERIQRPVLAGAVLVALFTIPTTFEELHIAHGLAAPTPENGNFIRSDERAAITYLAHNKEPGSVITRSYLGAVVPGRTGRHTYVGDCLWSEPGCTNLTFNAQWLFVGAPSGAPTPAAARSFVLSSGARFLLADCETTTDIPKLLGPVIRSTHSFGCAAVYEVE